MFNLDLVSKYRTELMGVATILIILCHMPAHGVAMPSILKTIIAHGGTGCDIFLLLSGLGMYHSLQGLKSNGGGILSWYRKRFARLMIPYLLICAPLFHVFAIREQWSIGQYFMRLSTLSSWTEGWGLWFVALIIVLYLVTPLLDKMLTGNKKWYWLSALVVLTWLSGSIPVSEGIVSHVQFGLCRVPCYLIGYVLAKEIMNEKQIKIWPVLVSAAGLYVLSQIVSKMSGVGVSVFWLEGVILTVLFIYVIEWCKRLPVVMKVLSFMGTISLESYCTNVFLLPFFLYLPWQVGGLDLNPGNWTYYLVGTTGCILVSWVVNRISRPLIKCIVTYGS